MITVINYGVGNLGSVMNMFKKINVEAQLSTSIDDIKNAKKLLLPGIGSFDIAMQKLISTGYLPYLNQKVMEEKVPTLGICLGMQLMTNGSEEGTHKGLGWFDAETVKFNLDTNIYKIPHMGWNDVFLKQANNTLTANLPVEPRFYFCHSYFVKCKNDNEQMLTCNYGNEFTCGINNENIYGVQFHPEKSHKYGMQLLKNFSTL
ncbi:MAG: imidazole glycerol phosphate synthase subunit HisH [Bacteroidia bacterium]|nr:imidazole glycerol phosphate synthase subunit HisH [Bacteroidia bacterium]